MKKILAIGLAAFFLAMLVAGCGGLNYDPSTGAATHTNIKTVEVNGRTVTCIVLTTTKGTASITCDWNSGR